MGVRYTRTLEIVGDLKIDGIKVDLSTRQGLITLYRFLDAYLRATQPQDKDVSNVREQHHAGDRGSGAASADG